MSKVCRIGLDIAKNFFQVCAVDTQGKELYNKKLRRNQVLSFFANTGDGKTYKNGRQFAASLGLTPREYSSGGKQKLSKIAKRGNKTIRCLLIQGTRIIGRYWQNVENTQDRRVLWYQGVAKRSNKFVAAVAQANKTARILWAMITRKEEYKAKLA